MASERLQRQIEILLDEAEAAIKELDWRVVHDRAQAVLAIDPENGEGRAFQATAERALGGSPPPLGIQSTGTTPAKIPTGTSAQPSSFANGRYQVKMLLGKGGKKKVYLAHDGSQFRPGNELCSAPLWG